MTLLPSASQAVSPQIIKAEFKVSFPPKSSLLSDVGEAELQKWLPKMVNRRGLSYVVVTGYSDAPNKNRSHVWQLGLAISRAKATERFLVEAGIPQERIYFEGKVVSDRGRFGEVVGEEAAGITTIQYGGTCTVESNCGQSGISD